MKQYYRIILCSVFVICFWSVQFVNYDLYYLFVEFGNQGESSKETDEVPIPKVIIDQDSDPDATIVEITFGDRLGALLDTVCCCLSLLCILIYYGLCFCYLVDHLTLIRCFNGVNFVIVV